MSTSLEASALTSPYLTILAHFLDTGYEGKKCFTLLVKKLHYSAQNNSYMTENMKGEKLFSVLETVNYLEVTFNIFCTNEILRRQKYSQVFITDY